jgi:hypothetical protein
MTEVDGETGAKPVDEAEGEEWMFRQNLAVRALLDHVAEELAAEFVRLMRVAVAGGAEQSMPKEREE